MPLSKKGKKVKKKLRSQYGKKKGDEVAYAMEAEGKMPGHKKKASKKKRRK